MDVASVDAPSIARELLSEDRCIARRRKRWAATVRLFAARDLMTISNCIGARCRFALYACAALACGSFDMSAAVAQTASSGKPVRSFLEMRDQGIVHQRWDLSCGAATLATLLAFQHHDPVPEPEIAKAMLDRTDAGLVNQRGGFSLFDMKQYVVGRGYEGTGYSGLTIDDLMSLAPVIVPVSLSKIDHFVVFRGRVGDRVVLADPAFGNRTMRVDRFQQVWQKKVGFVVTRPGSVPPSNLLTVGADGLRVIAGDMLRATTR